ncbi:MAG: YopX family protein [Dehalococcoidia bacterium]|jgi:uncharacterized phage protein (TIGR01671 family)
MNDRFIFRAWDKLNKRMIYIERFSQIPSNWEDIWILMQSTGLRDRAGKLIFEGDIVRRMVIDWDNTPEDYEDGKEAMREIMRDVVTLNRLPVYWLESESFGYEGEDLESPEDSEIIGNIYEHPELLKG